MPAEHKPAGFGSGGAAVTKVSVLHGISTKPSVPSFLPDIPAMTRYDACLLLQPCYGLPSLVQRLAGLLNQTGGPTPGLTHAARAGAPKL